MGVSSARPDNLEKFSSKSRSADRELNSALRTLVGAYSDFQSENRWGTLDADSLLSAFGRYVRGNGFTARWVAQIAAAFRRASGSGAIARLPDAAIKASLRAAGLDHDRNSVTFDGPVAYGSPPTTGYTNDPVNTATGNFVEVESDLRCHGLLEALTFQRTYNSRNERVGPFGRGWSSWATARLRARPDGAEFIGPDGQEALFPRMGDGYGRIVEVRALVQPLASGLALTWFGGAGRWEFDEAGLPVRASRGPGTEVMLHHDADGRLIELVHAGGKRVAVTWVGDRIGDIQCSDGRAASYRYDAVDNLVGVDGESGMRQYELDAHGRVVSVIDADGVVELVNTYDDDGRVVEQLSPFGRHTYLSYLPGRVTVTTDDDEDGAVNTYIHDAAGRLLAVIDGDDHQLSMSYDGWGNPISLTERNGAVTFQEWDDRARPRRRVLPSGAEFTFAYDDADRLVEVSSSAGGVTRYAYEGDERDPSEIVDPEGAVTQQAAQDGLVRRIVDPDGVTREFEFDADGNVIAAIDGHGNTTRLERDAAGRVTAAVTPLGRRSSFSYDDKGQLVERRIPGGSWRYEYTAAGRLAGVTGPDGAHEQTRYGKHGEPTAFVDPLGHVTATQYDVFGNAIEVMQADGSAWRHTYDALMRLTATVDPLGERWEREYDPNGTLVAKTAPDGVKVTASLDHIGRVIGIADGFTSIDFELDALGRVVELRRPDGTGRRTEYDLCGRPRMVQDATGAITRLQYTPGGRLARVLHPSGRGDAYEYDRRGVHSAFVDGAGRRWEFVHDPDGALVERRLPTGEIERFEYDAAGRTTRETVPGQGVRTYSYDEAGRVAGVSDREAGASRFEFDPAGRMVAATDANGATTRYRYDELGRLAQTIDPLGGDVRPPLRRRRSRDRADRSARPLRDDELQPRRAGGPDRRRLGSRRSLGLRRGRTSGVLWPGRRGPHCDRVRRARPHRWARGARIAAQPPAVGRGGSPRRAQPRRPRDALVLQT